MNKIIPILKFLIGWPLAILAIIFLIKLTIPNLSIVVQKIHSINLVLVLCSIVIFLCYFLLRAYLWKKIIQFKGYQLSFRKTAYLWEMSEFKRYVPGNVWSFLSRVSLFSDMGVDKKNAGLALLDEIQLLVMSSAIVSLFSLPLMLDLNENGTLLNQLRLIILASAVGIIVYSLIVAFIFKLRGNKNFLNNLFLPGYSLQEKLILLIISIITFFVFGVATLVACLAVFQFDFRLYFELSAFFTFAFLAGYLSFITPMGLGVREGVITLGLTGFTTLATAGFLSIFSRIILIISEVTFLLTVLFLEFINMSKQK